MDYIKVLLLFSCAILEFSSAETFNTEKSIHIPKERVEKWKTAIER